jgi:hypothetical protein
MSDRYEKRWGIDGKGIMVKRYVDDIIIWSDEKDFEPKTIMDRYKLTYHEEERRVYCGIEVEEDYGYKKAKNLNIKSVPWQHRKSAIKGEIIRIRGLNMWQEDIDEQLMLLGRKWFTDKNREALKIYKSSLEMNYDMDNEEYMTQIKTVPWKIIYATTKKDYKLTEKEIKDIQEDYDKKVKQLIEDDDDDYITRPIDIKIIKIPTKIMHGVLYYGLKTLSKKDQEEKELTKEQLEQKGEMQMGFQDRMIRSLKQMPKWLVAYRYLNELQGREWIKRTPITTYHPMDVEFKGSDRMMIGLYEKRSMYKAGMKPGKSPWNGKY